MWTLNWYSSRVTFLVYFICLFYSLFFDPPFRFLVVLVSLFVYRIMLHVTLPPVYGTLCMSFRSPERRLTMYVRYVQERTNGLPLFSHGSSYSCDCRRGERGQHVLVAVICAARLGTRSPQSLDPVVRRVSAVPSRSVASRAARAAGCWTLGRQRGCFPDGARGPTRSTAFSS